jgi:hypothetical protein
MKWERRLFLQRLGLSAAALSLPGWMQACSREESGSTVDDSAGGKPPRSTRAALERARRRGRPLLVIVVPDERQAQSDRGDTWGVYLNYADAEGLADLALCDVWCASAFDVRAAVPGVTGVDETTLAVLVETDGSAPGVVPMAAPPLWGSSGLSLQSDEELLHMMQAHNAWMREHLRAVIAPDAAVLTRRAAANRASRSDHDWRALGVSFDETAPASAALALHAPAFVRLRAERAAAERTQCLSLLADEAVVHLRAKPPPPARWARSEPCGAHIEGENSEGLNVPCGTAFTPVYSSRFLVFYVSDH